MATLPATFFTEVENVRIERQAWERSELINGAVLALPAANSKQPDRSWLLREHSGNESAVSISSLGVRIPLAELYAPTINCF